ncbi:hypothetical protein HZH66_012940 [Vespula vulgaris]|uniref:Uncharacterized protein n=1 Tax=Vespula vulgaris TaxID=7454 RepID=A0A834J8W4_VESVU|nr:hypothetical protein HZH66_012940 [Vespula vulgaris]
MPFFNNVTQVVRDGDSDRNDGGGVSMQVTTPDNVKLLSTKEETTSRSFERPAGLLLNGLKSSNPKEFSNIST